MKLSLTVLFAWLLGLANAPAANIIYTSQTAFLADLPAGYYLNDFSGLPGNVYNNYGTAFYNFGFTNGSPAVGYRLNAPSGLFFTDSPIFCFSPFVAADTATITFTTGNVLTIGANVFQTDVNGSTETGAVVLTFSDGTIATVPSTTSTASFGFFGISSATPITSVTMSSADFANMGNLYVSAKATVPTTTVKVVATTPNASQLGPVSGVFTVTRTNVNLDYSAPLTVAFILGGTATNGVYICNPNSIAAATTNTITLDVGQTSTNIMITPVAGTQTRPATTAVLNVVTGDSYAPTAPASATVFIQSSGLAISSLATSGANVVITFTSTFGADTVASFTVQSSGSANGTYADVSPVATITQTGPGVFQTTIAKSGAMQFYRLRHN